MANISWNVMLSLMITLSSVTYGFLTNVIDDVVREDAEDIRLFEGKEREREVKERALEKLQEVGQITVTSECSRHNIK
jgi:hypothetical protein